MRRIARALVRLYPANWRERYGDEFEALLEDSPATFRGVFDLLRGAIRMQLNVPAFPKLAVLLSIAGLLAGLGVSFIVAPRYVSTAVMIFDETAASEDSPRNLAGYFMRFENEVLSRTSLSNIMQDPRLDLYRRERARIPLEDVIQKMKADIGIVLDPNASARNDSLAFHISFGYPDRVKARDTVQVLLTKFVQSNLTMQSERARANATRGHTYDEVDSMEQRLAAIEKRLGINTPAMRTADFPAVPPDGLRLYVLDPPSFPNRPVYPNRSAFMLTGFGAGFAAALVVAIFRRRFPPIPFPAQTA